MENNTLENSKKTSAMEKVNSSGKMAESMKAAGSEENNLALATTKTIMEKFKENGYQILYAIREDCHFKGNICKALLQSGK